MTKKAKKIVKISVLSVVAFLLVCAITLYVVAVSIYKGSFDYRCETSTENTFTIEQFPSMKRERHTFRSNRQQQLVGYLYESADETQAKKGVVVFAHGLGAGGQRGYMDIFDSMTSNGYYVFAYDATANDESEGEVVGGLPQGYRSGLRVVLRENVGRIAVPSRAVGRVQLGWFVGGERVELSPRRGGGRVVGRLGQVDEFDRVSRL